MEKINIETKLFKSTKIKDKEKQIMLIKRHYESKYNFGSCFSDEGFEEWESRNLNFIKGHINIFSEFTIVSVYFVFPNRKTIEACKREYDKIKWLAEKAKINTITK